jgi:hypothetical protein
MTCHVKLIYYQVSFTAIFSLFNNFYSTIPISHSLKLLRFSIHNSFLKILIFHKLYEKKNVLNHSDYYEFQIKWSLGHHHSFLIYHEISLYKLNTCWCCRQFHYGLSFQTLSDIIPWAMEENQILYVAADLQTKQNEGTHKKLICLWNDLSMVEGANKSQTDGKHQNKSINQEILSDFLYWFVWSWW